nr:glyceraldehyde-3-phosphate dehydrogenase (phosphorylating) (EC 1.2.1.12) - bovine (fragments) [Bos taurus]
KVIELNLWRDGRG